MTARIDYNKQSPQLSKKFIDFSLGQRDSAIEAPLQYLVQLRASQLNGCAFCVDMHVKEATIHGERALRLHHVAIWRESPLFTPREKAALEWTELLTHLPPHGVSDEAFAQAREHFNEKELSDLTFSVVSINGWNRLNAAFRNEPGSADKMYGLDKAGLV
jgi:AhpD family alkylhydroperoxidase